MPAAIVKKKDGPSKDALRRSSADYARKAVAKMFEKSTIIDNSANYPKFDYEELQLGQVLGKGGFGTVSEIRAFKIAEKIEKVTIKKSKDDAEVEKGSMESRSFVTQHCIRNGGDSRYAVKILSPEVVDNPAHFLQGIIDMAIETRFLSDIEHPNIIKMRATAKCDPTSAAYFIAMDRLYDTLEKRLQLWEGRVGRTTGFAARLNDRSGKKAAALYEERIVCAFDLSAALEYLHKVRKDGSSYSC
jgi:serine/threonine protein kinase